MHTLHTHNANAVLLPLLADLAPDAAEREFLEQGGVSVVLATTGEEYAARRVSAERIASEHWWDVAAATAHLREIGGPGTLIGVDAEPTGVQRLSHLLPALPPLVEALELSDRELRERYTAYAEGARRLGINLFLAPVVDEITGTNEWLNGRTLSHDQDTVERIAGAYINACADVSVAATVKHYPGYSHLDAHPVQHDIELHTSLDELERQEIPFSRLVRRNVPALMLGPATVVALDPSEPPATSPRVMSRVRQHLGFPGIIITDDLDAASTMRGRSIGDTAVASVRAGADLLLIAGGEEIREVSDALQHEATRDGEFGVLLSRTAHRVRSFAERWAIRH
ncbi:glycoside hydrolase family 3 N-terminal domain-containing protein [Leucobacter musarum]|uniref:glycoside hydrolase family 3 N-terminal domain-containing protein n=1 Tax=Leucobacter musarum TaxID=1930747 RepID=UPI0006A76FE0|nr:glycoside hydrolase family 3 N-terminal domain-containing protein [Leucobacter musarum]